MTRSTFPYQTLHGYALLSSEALPSGPEVWRLFAAVRSEPYAFLLDSARTLPGRGRYSFIGGAPWLVFVAERCGGRDAQIELQRYDPDAPGANPECTRFVGDPFAELERLLAGLAIPHDVRAQLELPFIGGAVGYVGYDAKQFIEQLPESAQRDLALPDLCLMFVDELLAHDHETGLTQLLVTGRGTTAEEASEAAERTRARARARFEATTTAPRQQLTAAYVPEPIHAHATAEQYAETVRAAQAQILAGNAFQVCTTHRLDLPYDRDAFALYRALRQTNPAPFACFLQLPFAALVSSSPERFVSLTHDRIAESRPIKGTRPRGLTPEHDAGLRAELEASDKDRAENVMIVDLVRNDFGRVCEVDSIHVPELMIIEDHPSVFQLVSTVRGRLAPEHSAVQLFRACFPPGSMTGAPKIEAMKIIDTLEPFQRGIYSGAVGYFDLGGGMDFSVVIRSFVIAHGHCYFGVGGGVVADSEPHAEYLESMDKAEALLAALALAADGGSR